EDLVPTAVSSVTYNELINYVIKFGKALKAQGIKDRTHIAVIGENRVQWGIVYLTAMCFNHVIVPIDKNLSTGEIINIIHESDSEVIIFSESFEPLMLEEMHVMKKIKHF